jgi:PAS domain S-box-containing protein
MLAGLWLTKASEQRARRNGKQFLADVQAREQTLQAQAGELNQTIGLLRDKEVREARQSWVQQGLVELGEVLQQTTDRQQLADQVLLYLVKRVGANQAALFLAEDEGAQTRLALVAAYAYDRKKYLEQKLRPGHGLVGQTFLEAETTVIDQLPPDYTPIASSLGQAPPRQLVLVPLPPARPVLGVLEMAFFQPAAPHQIAFLAQAATATATSLKNASQQAQLQRLLAQANDQARLLQDSEQEMRGTMSELVAAQEQLDQVTHLSKQIFSATNNLLGYVELGLDRRVILANHNFAHALGYTPDELMGQPHRVLAGHIPEAEYEQFWAALASGRAISENILRRAKSGELVQFRATYQPLLSQQGQVAKVIKLAYRA